MKKFKIMVSIMTVASMFLMQGCSYIDEQRPVVKLDNSTPGHMIEEGSSPGFNDCVPGRVKVSIPYTKDGKRSAEVENSSILVLRCPNSKTTSIYAVGKNQLASVAVNDGGEASVELGPNEEKAVRNDDREKKAQSIELEIAEKRRAALAKLTPEDIDVLKINK